MNVIETALPGVLIMEPKVFGDERGFFTRVSTPRHSRKRPGSSASSFRTTIHGRSKACCVACTTNWKTPRASWFG